MNISGDNPGANVTTQALPAAVRDRLQANAEDADRLLDWPASSWEALRSAGVQGWSIVKEYGGAARSQPETLRDGEAISSSCLTMSFILTQQEAAIRMLMKGPPQLRERYLPRIASGEIYMTVGLSHLTTSRQHQAPPLRATPVAGGYTLDGQILWVTGADHADAIVIGATLPDTTQVILVLPAGQPGVTIAPPLLLASCVGSRTSSIHFENVAIGPELVVLGPTERVLGKIAGGGLDTSGPAIGLASAATAFLRHEAENRPALAEPVARLEGALVTLRQRLLTLAADPIPEANLALRVDCSRLVLQATQLALLAAKGAGFVATHPAQRWARQALFFLVWSNPPQVVDGLLAGLLPNAVEDSQHLP